jgi:hypothetical protein
MSISNNHSEYRLFFVASKQINFYTTFAIAILGIFCNSLTVISILRLRTRLKPCITSSQYYMLSLALINSLFLAAHIIEDIMPEYTDNPDSFFQFVNKNMVVCKLTLSIRNSTRVISAYLGKSFYEIKIFFSKYYSFIILKLFVLVGNASQS